MTKTLTEQWRERRLERGCYIIKLYGDKEMAACYNDITETFHTDNGTYTTSVKEILARVPSHTELTLMACNYRLATKALRDCYNEMKYWATMNHRCSKIFNHIKEALVEIEEVK